MKYTEDYPHRPILGKAGEFVDILSRVPADTDIVLDVATYFSSGIAPSALEISIGNYRPFEHIIHLKDDGTLENTLKVNIRAEWNRDENMEYHRIVVRGNEKVLVVGIITNPIHRSKGSIYRRTILRW